MLAVIDNLYEEYITMQNDSFKLGKEDGVKIGEKIGEKRGEEKTLQQIVKNMLNKEYPIENISEMTGLKIEEVKKIVKEIKLKKY